jgi:HAMP domain-containing protein
MLTFRDTPIKQKLMIIIMATTTAALLLAGIGIVAFDSFLFRGYLERDLSALARIIADNSTAAISFDDPQTAAETLAALRAKPHLVTACVYRADGTMLAKYARPGASAGCLPPTRQDELRFSGQGLKVSQAVVLSGRRIGTLVLLYDLNEIGERMKLYGVTVLGVLLASSLLALLLSSKLGAVIANPVSQLARAATSVSGTGDYSVRAQKLSGDELGVLVDRFNEMLAGIQSRDGNLRTALRDREEALRDAEKARERFRFLAESMPQKIFTATPGGEGEYYNRQWIEYTGLTSGIGNDRSKPASRSSLSSACAAPMECTDGICAGPAPCEMHRAASPCGSDRTRISTSRRRPRRNCGRPMRTSRRSPIPPVTICRSPSGMLPCTAKS